MNALTLRGVPSVGRAAIPIAFATLALAMRNPSMRGNAVLILAGVAGMLVPVVKQPAAAVRWIGVTALGVALFWAGRELGPAPIVSLNWFGMGVLVMAGVCEEALFRRGMYGIAAQRWGDNAAIVATALVFALIHVPLYGWNTLAINIGAGVLLGWQRKESGSWTSPAVTHALANLFQARWL